MSPQPAYRLLNPHGTAPILLACDHASRAFPPHLGTLGLPEPLTFDHIAWDVGAGPLAEALAEALDAPLVQAGWSRLVVDCNRRLDDPSAFPAASDGVPIPGNADFGEADRLWRIGHCYEPYHRALETQLLAMQRHGCSPILVAIHSFTPQLRTGGGPRPWHVGVLWDKDERLAWPLLDQLRRVPGLVVGDNVPYSGRHPGDYTVDHHAEARGLAHVALEVRQDLLADEAGIGRWAGILAGVLRPFATDPRGLPPRPAQRLPTPHP